MESSGLDETFRLLQNARRRFVLHSLRHRAERADVSELASALAAWESGGDESVTEEGVGTVELSLHHAHLPRLAEAGTVSYDPETNRVALADTAPVEPYLSTAERVDRPLPWDGAGGGSEQRR